MATRLPGYRRKAGLARRYVTPEGAEISYRKYRQRVETTGAVKRLSAEELANAQRRQREFNNIIRQMAKVRKQALENALENTEAALARTRDEAQRAELEERIQMYQRLGRRTKQEAIRSPARKEAIHTLEDVANRRFTDKRGVRHYRSKTDELKAREALIALGRREGVPEYVPVGYSDKKRSWSRFRPR